ncbi:hypothetical protein L226DRAFT_573188 [Lentinus tigrinus ALCF2SS1-7]|uniref:uncharacterized protein n=1 Tax=Lentinus tigrinus ALCF2SS1-7 TaxID=1328758 RepID=UPI001165DD97|nr:hypothetical protein L226DRAFT_573188 [Lentinus tigrinus ALCF2SS1-7]
MSTATNSAPVDLLILGAGWTSKFLIPLCAARGISHAATSRSGRDDTIKFEFDPASDDAEPFRALPDAQTVLITFPIYRSGASARLVRLYEETHPSKGSGSDGRKTAFVQLGSSGIWDGGPTAKGDHAAHFQRPDVKEGPLEWTTRHSKFNESNERGRAEIELLALSPDTPTTVLDLCGLWGGPRQVRNFVPRVITSKEVLKGKGSIHMIHGLDVSRAILAVHANFERAAGERWLLTDGRVYDWWDWASAWGEEGKQTKWVRELMNEEGIHALPRSPEVIGRGMDSREFWNTFDLEPVKGRLGEE